MSYRYCRRKSDQLKPTERERKRRNSRVGIINELFAILSILRTEMFPSLSDRSRVIRIEEDKVGSLREFGSMGSQSVPGKVSKEGIRSSPLQHPHSRPQTSKVLTPSRRQDSVNKTHRSLVVSQLRLVPLVTLVPASTGAHVPHSHSSRSRLRYPELPLTPKD